MNRTTRLVLAVLLQAIVLPVWLFVVGCGGGGSPTVSRSTEEPATGPPAAEPIRATAAFREADLIEDPETGRRTLRGRLLLQLDPESGPQANLEAVRALGYEVLGWIESAAIYQVAVPPELDPESLARSLLAGNPALVAASAEPAARLASYIPPELAGADPSGKDRAWAWIASGAAQAPNHFPPNQPPVIAFLDTGVNDEHPDLAGRVAAARDFVIESGRIDPADANGHGTAAAAIAAANAFNGEGAAGVCGNCRVLSAKVCSARGFCPLFSALAGLEWAAANGAAVVNLSWAADNFTAPERQMLASVIDRLAARGVLVVAAAGNKGVDASDTVPAALDNVLTVGAVNPSGRRPEFSNWGHAVDMAAPGVSVFTLDLDGVQFATGTSYAAAFVSGAAARLWLIKPDLSREQVIEALLQAVDPVVSDRPFGAGRLNLAASIAIIQDLAAEAVGVTLTATPDVLTPNGVADLEAVGPKGSAPDSPLWESEFGAFESAPDSGSTQWRAPTRAGNYFVRFTGLLHGEPIRRTLQITVQPGPAASLSVAGPVEAKVGDRVQLRARIADEFDNEIRDPVRWRMVSGPGTISDSGALTAASAGTVTVSAASGSLAAGHTVVFAQAEDAITVKPSSLTAITGRSYVFYVQGKLTDERGIILIPTWSVEGGIGTITADGRFTALRPGAGEVRVAVGELEARARVRVVAGDAVRIELEPCVESGDPLLIPVGESFEFTAAALDSEDNRLPAGLEYAVEGGIGHMAGGQFTAAAPGRGTITAVMGEARKECLMEVTAGEPRSLILAPETVQVRSGETAGFTRTLSDSSGAPASGAVVWELDSPVGAVDAWGRFTAAEAGRARLRALHIRPNTASAAIGARIVDASSPQDAEALIDGRYSTAFRRGAEPAYAEIALARPAVVSTYKLIFAADALPSTYTLKARAVQGGWYTVRTETANRDLTALFNAPAQEIDRIRLELPAGPDAAGVVELTALERVTGPEQAAYWRSLAGSPAVTVIEAWAWITVTQGPLTTLEVEPNPLVVAPGRSRMLVALAADAAGNRVRVEPAFSGAEALGRVENGVFLAQSPGEGTLTATYHDPESGTLTAHIPVTVAGFDERPWSGSATRSPSMQIFGAGFEIAAGADPWGLHRTSEFLIGSVSVNLVFLQGPDQAWTPAEMSRALAGIQEGLNWLGGREPLAQASWRVDPEVFTASIPPASLASFDFYRVLDEYARSRGATGDFAELGAPDGEMLALLRLRTLAHELRRANGTQWAAHFFVVRDEALADGLHAFAYNYELASSLGRRRRFPGPAAVLTYENGPWGVDNMDKVAAHETAHLFGALDQYQPCSVADQSGYLSAPNTDCGAPGGIMSDATPALSPSTRAQLGWLDADSNSALDPLDPARIIPSVAIADGRATVAARLLNRFDDPCFGVEVEFEPEPGVIIAARPTTDAEGRAWIELELEQGVHWVGISPRGGKPVAVAFGSGPGVPEAWDGWRQVDYEAGSSGFDPAPGLGSITLRDRTSGNAGYSDELTVSVTLSGVTGSPINLVLAQDAGFTVNISNIPLPAADIEYALTAGDGLRTVYAKLQEAGPVDGNTVSDSITIDTVDPVVTVVGIQDTTIGSADWVKNGDSIQATATVTDANIGDMTASHMLADLTELGGGAAVAASSFNPGTGAATWVFSPVSGSGEGVRNVTVTAFDPAGNSHSLAGSITADNTPPSVADAALFNNTLGVGDLLKDGDSITLTAVISDNNLAAMTAADVTADLTQLGGAAALAADSFNPATGAAQWDFTAGPGSGDGVRTVTITALDPARNSGTGADSIMADNSGPTITGITVADSIRGATVYVKNDDVVTISANVADAAGVASVVLDLSALGGPVDAAPDSFAAGVAAWNDHTVSGTVDGVRTIAFTAVDTLDNSRTVTHNLTADNTGPSMTDGITLTTTSLRVQFSENLYAPSVSADDFELDDGALTPLSTSVAGNRVTITFSPAIGTSRRPVVKFVDTGGGIADNRARAVQLTEHSITAQDGLAPVTPYNLRVVVSCRDVSLDLYWTNRAGETDLTRHHIYRDESPAGAFPLLTTLSGPAPYLPSPYGEAVPGPSFYYRVATCDTSDNCSNQSAAVGGIFDCYTPIAHFGQPTSWGGSPIGDEMHQPHDVAAVSTGLIAVADTGNHRIQLRNTSGAVVRNIGTAGGGPGQLDQPWGVAVDGADRLFVADYINNRIQILDLNGDYIDEFAVQGPIAVDVNAAGDSVFVLRHNQELALFINGEEDVDGPWPLTALPDPAAIDRSSDGSRILTACRDTDSVRVYDTATAGLITEFGGSLSRPSGVKALDNGSVLVTDTGNNRIVLYSSSLVEIEDFGQFGYYDGGDFNSPQGLDFMDAGVIVADTNNYRVQLIKPQEDLCFGACP